MLIPTSPLTSPGSRLKNNIATQVIEDFLRMPEGGSIIRIHQGPNFPNGLYSSGINNHFQGLQRTKDGLHFIATAGAKKTNEGHLFVKEIFSHTHRIPQQDRIKRIMDYNSGPIGNNSLVDPVSQEDVNIKTYEIESGNGSYWHAGGFSILDHILVVPVEKKFKLNGKTVYNSKVLLIDVSDLNNPQRASHEINRLGMAAGASAIVQLSNNLYLCAVWTDSDSLDDRFDFYLSQSDDVYGPYNKIGSVKGSAIDRVKKDKPKFQNINFIQEASGRLYLIGFSNKNPLVSVGDNYGYLMEVFSDNLLHPSPAIGIDAPSVQYLHKKFFGQAHSYCDFSASAGAHIATDGQMIIYGGHHFRRNGMLKLSEYTARIKNYPRKIINIQDSVIELYDHEFFGGRCLKIYGTQQSTIMKYGDIIVSGRHFDNGVSAMRFLLPENITYNVYYKEGCDTTVNNKIIPLKGTGNVVEWAQLGNDNGVASSSKYD